MVLLTHNYPRHPGDVAGNFLHPLAQALIDRGTDLTVVAPSDRGNVGAPVLDGVPVLRVRYASPERETLAYTGRMTDALRSPSGMTALAGMIRAMRHATRELCGTGRDSIVHAQWWVPAGLALPGGIPSVITCHGTDVRLLDGNPLVRGVGKRVLRRARVVTTVSTRLARVIRARTGRAIDDGAVQPMPVATLERPRSAGGRGLVALGRLSEQKRLPLALAALALLHQRGLAVPLTIVGDGPARPSLETEAKRLGLADAVRFVGAVPPDRVPAALDGADAMVMPAVDEGLGLAAAEALMQGIPVIGCEDGGGLLDVVPRTAGGRVVAATPAAIAAGIEAVLGLEGERAAAWEAGQAWRERLSPAYVAERCLAWYEEARRA